MVEFPYGKTYYYRYRDYIENFAGLEFTIRKSFGINLTKSDKLQSK